MKLQGRFNMIEKYYNLKARSNLQEPEDLVAQIMELQLLAPAGFALALHINFTTPRLLLQTYDQEWVKFYSEHGLVMSDPTVLWGFKNEGSCPWSEMTDMDPAEVLPKAAEFGMKFGLTCAVEAAGSRSIGSMARSDMEFDAQQREKLLAMVTSIHNATAKETALDAELRQKLSGLGVNIQASR